VRMLLEIEEEVRRNSANAGRKGRNEKRSSRRAGVGGEYRSQCECCAGS